ncbi:hypothetical protein TEA_020468 [Camellia sinensis var. sinensis]|uniref:Pentacotripeptide-repeat region of PRORP domain-containing protein n=1 Tax=Camellia sinensis var. sinensis TaxID=542762 RepID=A0A4S4D408_CAMSN|nr:hypothetical protein TEA_020468 [Camellia sinensis var. sinensis]
MESLALMKRMMDCLMESSLVMGRPLGPVTFIPTSDSESESMQKRHHRSLVRALGVRHFAASTEEYAKRNYANNDSEYNTVIASLTSQRRHYLLRDVYDDMMLDGVKPERDTFHSLIAGAMKGARLQDAFFFRDEMKAMGLVPDALQTRLSREIDLLSREIDLLLQHEIDLLLQREIDLLLQRCLQLPPSDLFLKAALYNFLISTCGKCKNSQQAIQLKIFEEMRRYEVKPTGQTYICLLNSCAAAGRLDRVYAIVRDMTAAGLGLNKFCYAGLIAAHKNKTPITDDTATKIIELVEQSKGWSSVEGSRDNAENFMMGISEEELYNTPTAEYVHRRSGFLHRELTVYHVAFHACADLRNVEVMETLLELLRRDNKTPDVFILIQVMRCYLHFGDIERGQKIFEEYMKSGKQPMVELYVTLAEGAMVGYTPKGMQLALETLENMTSRDFFLSPKMGNDLLLVAAGEKTGGYTMANYVWDLMQARKIIPSLPAVEAYYNGLKERDIPEDDQRLIIVTRTYNNLRQKIGPGPGRGQS